MQKLFLILGILWGLFWILMAYIEHEPEYIFYGASCAVLVICLYRADHKS